TVTSGYTKGYFISHLLVRGDVLAVAARDQNAIMIYKKASSITADVAPDFTITDPKMTLPSHLALDGAGRLYAVDQDSVLVFRDVATGPTLATEITPGGERPAAVALE